MANHKSEAKRSRQTIKKTIVNKKLTSKIKNSYKKVLSSLSEDNNGSKMQESVRIYNSFLSKGIKAGLINKGYASRKLSSISKIIKKIS